MLKESTIDKVAWPSIAIVTPSFNQSRFLPACIGSVLDQNYLALQYAIIDGGSTDCSVEIIKSKASSLHYWRSHPDEGPYAAIAEGFTKTDAEVLGWINSDDILLPWALRVVGGIFRDCPEVQWITTETPIQIGADGLPKVNRITTQFPGFNQAGFQHRENLAAPGSPPGAMFIQQESTFWRRSLWESAGAQFDSRFKLAGDFELWDRFFNYAQLYSINLPLGAFRRYDAHQASVGKFAQYIAECEKVLSRHGDTAPNSKALIARRAMMIGLNIPELEQQRKPVYVVRPRADGRYVAKRLEWSDI
jgi:glycosyltransferase involved in cell wall biosynthesis